MKIVHIETLGCKVNQYESAAIAEQFESAGYQISEDPSESDIYVINTCTVTNRTDFKSRNLIRKALKFKEGQSGRIVVVTGCYAQREKDEALDLGEIDLIIDNNHKNNIVEAVENLINHREDRAFRFFDSSEFSEFTEIPSVSMGERSRAFVKIQDGCDFFCAYCAVPYARGKPRSRSRESILAQVREMVDRGYREFVLAGINLGLYGCDFIDNYRLSDVIEEICDIPGVSRVRLSSIEPQLITDKLLDLLATRSNFCPHLHIPLQTGCDELLKKMKRKYDTVYFKDLLHRLHAINPTIAIGLDIIVGLPGEDDQLFEETYNLLTALDFTYLHVFIYSKRSGTEAARMPKQVHGAKAKERSAKLLALSAKKTQDYMDRLITQKVRLGVVIEGSESGYAYGTSDRYVKVYVKGHNFNKGEFVEVVPTSFAKDGLECFCD